MAAQNELAPAATAKLASGTLIGERYRIESVLGEGGMGIVYLAEHVHIRKLHALKVLLPKLTNTPEMVTRFEREAIAAGAVSHPNVASASDFGRLADGSFFLVLEYLEGRTLRAELAQGTLPTGRALAIARGIALGAQAAHAKGIVHRDLKPENVMLVARDGDRDFVKVLDFGLARLEAGASGAGAPLTCAGTIVGTPHYMAPEQVSGASIDARADLYALGVILFEMLTGDRPFKGGAITVMRHHLQASAPPLSSPAFERIPPDVQPLVARLLQKEASARYASAAEVVAALDARIAALTAPTARAPTPPAAERTPTKRLPAVASPERPAIAGMLEERVARVVAWVRARPRTLLAAGAGVAVLALLVAVTSRKETPAPVQSTAGTHDAELAAAPSAAIELDDPTPAPGDAVLSCLEGKFGDRVERGQPAGDAQGIVAARKAIYWVDLANHGRPTHVTLVWRIDGREVQRQTLDVGRSSHWRTWGAHKVDGAREIDVQVLDASGRALKADSLTLAG